ncbi:MAG: PAS domain S-box protein, partial [Elusimicrobiales bacterium]|nr:PAS domain S-box protein [Elusimicrobiales bacterium]
MSGNFLIRKIFKYENKLKIAVMTAMLGFCLFLTYYFNLVLQREVLFTHFFYIPIILATMWWKRKGLFAPFFLSIVLVSIHFYEFGTGNDIYNTILRASAFIIIGALIAYLREWIDKDAEQIKVSVNLLKESEEKFKSMVDCSDGLVTTINSLGIITFINNNAVKYGYKPKEIIGKSMTDFIHPDDIEFMLKIFENGIKTGKFVKSIILRFKKKDGTFFYGEHRAGVICKNGEVDSIIGHMYDITERRDKEILLKESEEKFR